MNIIHIEGTNAEMGQQLGNATKDKIHSFLKLQKTHFKNSLGKTFEDIKKDSARFLPVCKKYFSQYVDELEGISKGASVDFMDLFALTCEEEIFSVACTNIVGKTSQGIILGHNEDWTPISQDFLCIISAKPVSGPKFINVTYVGQIPGFTIGGLNTAGIGFAGTSLYISKKVTLGVPKAFLQRALLDCINIEQVKKILEFKPRTLPSYTTIIDKNGTVLSAEALKDTEIIRQLKDPFVHTNHLIELDFKDVKQELDDYKNTFTRYKRAMELLPNIRDIDSMMMALSDHKGLPVSICHHDENFKTIASTIIDPAHNRMLVKIGMPCKAKTVEVTL